MESKKEKEEEKTIRKAGLGLSALWGLGAAGAIEAISCILSIEKSIIPPTINHVTYDDNIDKNINFTFNRAQNRDVNIAMSNTFGFGGHNACVVFKKFKQ